jgi:hypothetical protein
MENGERRFIGERAPKKALAIKVYYSIMYFQ